MTNIPIQTVTEKCERGTFLISDRPETWLSVVNRDILIIIVVETLKVSYDSTASAFQSEALFGSYNSCNIADGEITCKTSQLIFRNPEQVTPCNPMIDYNVVREGNGSRKQGEERTAEEEHMTTEVSKCSNVRSQGISPKLMKSQVAVEQRIQTYRSIGRAHKKIQKQRQIFINQ